MTIVLVALVSSAHAANVRKPVLAGSWYEAEAEHLARDVDGFLSRADTGETDIPPAGLIVPHAGYRYSGTVAGYAYKLLRNHPIKRVIILAPCHGHHLDGASILSVTHYETPLGRVELDRAVCDALISQPYFRTVPAAHAREHSIEIQLPFLQRVLSNFKIVPVLIGSGSKKALDGMASAIAKHTGPGTLIIASSDFTHYGSRFGYTPFDTDIPEKLRTLDMGAVEKILAHDGDGFYDYQQKTGATICGRLPIYVLLKATSGNSRAELLKYDTSGRMERDFTSSVSYVSVAFFAGAAAGNTENFLKKDEEKTLLAIARRALESYVRRGKKLSSRELAKFDVTVSMRAKRGVFVTLEQSGQLRGCIGYVTGIKPVFEAVADNTVSACSRDSRFRSVTPEELGGTDISISVMSELIPVKNTAEIKVGRDGLVIEKGGRRGILLPQVPVELGWNRNRFLQGICRKAGLPGDAWKEANLWRFSAQVFHEK